MIAVVRIQALARARRVRMSTEGQAVQKNNMTKSHATRSSSSPSSELRSLASSSFCASTTPFTMLASDRTEGSNSSRPNDMSLTESTKAKRILRQSKSMSFSPNLMDWRGLELFSP